MGRTGHLRLGAICLAIAVAGAAPAQADAASSVTVVGSLQSELGCPQDWDPACVASRLAYEEQDRVWQGTFDVPAGSWSYKVALDGSWDENYGAGAVRDGPDIDLDVASPGAVKFYFDPVTHWVADSRNEVIATAVGSFQSELGCASDWDPTCLRSWLQDPDGDGVLSFDARLPAGSYEAKVTHHESWDENYGADGIPGGANIPFTVAGPDPVPVAYDTASHVLTIGEDEAVNRPPVARDVELTAAQGTSTHLTLDASDPDGDALSFAVTDGPAHGHLECAGPECVYRPAEGFSGTDSATYTATDPSGATATAQIRITVPFVAQATRLDAHAMLRLQPLAVRLTFSATLTRARDGAPVVGRRVTFTAGGRTACTAVTGGDGRASCSSLGSLLAGVLGGGYQAGFAGDGQYAPSSDVTPLIT